MVHQLNQSSVATIQLTWQSILWRLLLTALLSTWNHYQLVNTAHKEIETAAQHAGYAASAITVKDTHMHLHHAINCMVGPMGLGYDSNFADPCKGMGDGALNDTQDATAKTMVDQALSLAKVGVQIEGKAAAQDTAKAVQQLLTDAGKNTSM